MVRMNLLKAKPDRELGPILINPLHVVTVEHSGDPGKSLMRMSDGAALTVHGSLDHVEEALSPNLMEASVGETGGCGKGADGGKPNGGRTKPAGEKPPKKEGE